MSNEQYIREDLKDLKAAVADGFRRNSDQNRAIMDKVAEVDLKASQALQSINGDGALLDRVNSLESSRTTHERVVWKAVGFFTAVTSISASVAAFFGAKLEASGVGSALLKLLAFN